MLNQSIAPAALMNELPLKLARKCVDVLGVAPFEEEGVAHTVNTGMDEEIATICSGKEFGLIRTNSGKVFIYLFIYSILFLNSLLNLYFS